MPRIAHVLVFACVLLVMNIAQYAYAGTSDVDLNFTLSYTSEDVCDTVLGQNSPNPFQVTTDISLCVPKQTAFEVAIFNVLGKCIDTYTATDSKAGTYLLQLNCEELPPGIYFYRLTFDIHTTEPLHMDTKKMMCVE